MLISVTSPRKGLGQTVTAINLTAVLAQLTQERPLLIDINKYCPDVGYYLSDTNATRGLDDFISLFNSNLLDHDSFNTCVKTVYDMDIMSANTCLDINGKAVRALAKYSDDLYKVAVVDTIGGNNPLSRTFFELSDLIVIVISQSRHVMDIVADSGLYRVYKDKLVFIVNKYMEKPGDDRISYTLGDAAGDLKLAGYEGDVHALSFDACVLNECNDHALLNYIHNSTGYRQYYEQLTGIAGRILEAYGSLDMPGYASKKKKSRKVKFLNLF